MKHLGYKSRGKIRQFLVDSLLRDLYRRSLCLPVLLEKQLVRRPLCDSTVFCETLNQSCQVKLENNLILKFFNICIRIAMSKTKGVNT